MVEKCILAQELCVILKFLNSIGDGGGDGDGDGGGGGGGSGDGGGDGDGDGDGGDAYSNTRCLKYLVVSPDS